MRTPRYVYVEYQNGDREFYDLTIDPYQLRNRVTDAAYRRVIRRLRQQLAALRQE